jgi:hypothetical protein
MAQLYERARAAPLAVAAVARRLHHLAAQRAQMPSEVAKSLGEAEHYTVKNDRPAKPSEACQLVAELVRLRSRCYGASRTQGEQGQEELRHHGA